MVIVIGMIDEDTAVLIDVCISEVDITVVIKVAGCDSAAIVFRGEVGSKAMIDLGEAAIIVF